MLRKTYLWCDWTKSGKKKICFLINSTIATFMQFVENLIDDQNCLFFPDVSVLPLLITESNQVLIFVNFLFYFLFLLLIIIIVIVVLINLELVHCGCKLKDDLTLDSYGIKSGSTLHILKKVLPEPEEEPGELISIIYLSMWSFITV